MRILITGAAGTLGTALAPALAAAGHEPVLFDIQSLDVPYRAIQGDVRRPEDVRKAAEGVDFIIHTAAIHGIHLRNHSAQEFYDLNITGTFNVWEAAVATGVQAVLFSSTMGVYGESRRPADPDAVAAVREDLPLQPTDVYGFSKVVGEEMSRFYLRKHGIPSIALRYGMFVPEPFFRNGIRLLYGGVDVADVVEAVLAAMRVLIAGQIEWDAFNVESSVPFSAEDGPQLRRDPLPVLDKYYPGSSALLRERGVDRLQPLQEYFPMERAARLGFRPRHNFAEWLEALRARPEERAEQSPPWP